MLTTHTSNDPLLFAAQALNEILRTHTDRATLLLLPGGSAQAIAAQVDPVLLSSRTTLSVGDERWTLTPEHSNTAQLVTLPAWQTYLLRGVRTIDPRPHVSESLQDTSARFDRDIKLWHNTHSNGVVVAVLGIGTDGHLAGVLPMPTERERFASLFLAPHPYVRGYHSDTTTDEHASRMTITLRYLMRHVTHTIVYATGPQKRAALSSLDVPGPIADVPARILHHLQQVDIYTDQDVRAAQQHTHGT